MLVKAFNFHLPSFQLFSQHTSHRLCSKICKNRWLSRDSCESWQHNFHNVCSEPSSSIDSMVKYSQSGVQIFTPLDCYFQWILFDFRLFLFPHVPLNSIRCDIKGFIITIQSNSIRIEVASTWRRRRLMMVRQVDCFWRALNFEMVATTVAIPKALFPRRDLFMYWTVSDTLTLYSFMLSNLMELNAIFSPFFCIQKRRTSGGKVYERRCTLLLFTQRHSLHHIPAVVSSLSNGENCQLLCPIKLTTIKMCMSCAVKWNWCSEEASNSRFIHSSMFFVFFSFFIV